MMIAYGLTLAFANKVDLILIPFDRYSVDSFDRYPVEKSLKPPRAVNPEGYR